MIATMMLVCAVAASLGVGVMLAQVICVVMFRVFRMHATQVAARRKPTAAARLGVVEN